MKNQLYILLFFLFLFNMSCQTESKPMAQKKSIAFVGSYTQKEGHVDGKGAGVSIYETGPKKADWKLLSSFSDIINPSYLCLSPKHPIIYAVSEQGPDVAEPKSVIKVIQYDAERFEMKELQSISAEGHAPCYVSTDRDGRFLFVANYVSGNVVQYEIKADGTLSKGKSTAHQGTGPDARQESPHLHFIAQHPKREEVYAVDLGTDLVVKYEFGQNGLVSKDSIATEAGAGPRHLSWHPEGRVFYVLGELNGSIETWRWDESGHQRLQAISLKPEADDRFAGAGDIHISKDGRFVYASLRGDFGEIVVLGVDSETYALSVIQRVPAGGAVPRHFKLSAEEDYLAVALQNSDRVVLFARDKERGILGASEVVEVFTPVCLVFEGG